MTLDGSGTGAAVATIWPEAVITNVASKPSSVAGRLTLYGMIKVVPSHGRTGVAPPSGLTGKGRPSASNGKPPIPIKKSKAPAVETKSGKRVHEIRIVVGESEPDQIDN